MVDPDALMKKAVEFHGHECPGLALGVLVSKYIIENQNIFSIDEELVSIVENDNCSVDALQALLGTTFGKGNLIFKDYGKNNYTFYNRKTEDAVSFKLMKRFADKELSRQERIKQILHSSAQDLFKIESIKYKSPERAQIFNSLICENCGEPTMETRIKNYKGKNLCIPCFENLNRNKTKESV